jgi:ATP-binding cassette subfamily B protein
MSKTPESVSLHAKTTLRFYLRATMRYPLDSWLIFLLPISNVLFSVVMPLFASKILASLITHSALSWQYLGWFSAITVVSLVCNAIGIRRCMALQAKTMRDLHDDMFSRLLQRSVGFYNNQVGGKLVSDALDFVNSYSTLFNAIFIGGLSFVLTTVIGLAIVMASSWVMGVSILALLIALTYWTVIETRRRSAIRGERLKIGKRLTAHLSDNIVNAVTVKMFATEQIEATTNRAISKELATTRATDWQRTTTNETERMGVLMLIQIILLGALIKLSANDPHLLTTGIFAFTYTLTLINRFAGVNTMARQLEDSLLQASPMSGLLLQDIEITDAPDAAKLRVKHGEIICKDVDFRYDDAASKEHVFKNLNLHITPGEKIGLVGHSGGGKSTLTRLLLRFDDISGGSISIDGQDIRSVTQTSLREHISYVPQEPLLFHRTIRENIAYGNAQVSQKDVERAARLAYAHDFIAKLPDGYDTIVGERGVKLSGGQRQRVAIARAILKDAPILVLDEATSALDSESEKAIQKALWKLMEHRTTVVVAHRLSTIQKMDRIIVLGDGKIMEQGSHAELLTQKGTYAKLWTHQSGGFIEE